MIEFKPVRLEDRAVIERYTMPSGICNCDLAFANTARGPRSADSW